MYMYDYIWNSNMEDVFAFQCATIWIVYVCLTIVRVYLTVNKYVQYILNIFISERITGDIGTTIKGTVYYEHQCKSVYSEHVCMCTYVKLLTNEAKATW
jgi:hypothetical protein